MSRSATPGPAGTSVGAPLQRYDAWHRRLDLLESGTRTGAALQLDSTWHRLVLPRLGELRGLRVVEVGCGRGDLSIHMALNGARVTALDVSPAAIAIARERAARLGVDVDWRAADALDTGLPSETFHLAVSCECLEHVLEPRRMALELRRLLIPRGRCLLTTPSYLNAMALAWLHGLVTRRPYDSGAGVQPVENFFLYPLVRRLLRRAGFRILDADARLFPFLLLPGCDPARLRVERFRRQALNRLLRPFGLHVIYVLEKLSMPSDGS